MNKFLLETENVKLRAVEPQDVDLLYKWENNTEIWRISNTLVPFSKFLLKKYIENSYLDIYQVKQLRLIIDYKRDTLKSVGTIELFDFDAFHQRAGIGILIAENEFRRKHIASEALTILVNYCFEILQLHQIFCNISATNEASLNLFKNQGFEIIGVKKDWLKSLAGWEDELMLQKISEI